MQAQEDWHKDDDNNDDDCHHNNHQHYTLSLKPIWINSASMLKITWTTELFWAVLTVNTLSLWWIIQTAYSLISKSSHNWFFFQQQLLSCWYEMLIINIMIRFNTNFLYTKKKSSKLWTLDLVSLYLYTFISLHHWKAISATIYKR